MAYDFIRYSYITDKKIISTTLLLLFVNYRGLLDNLLKDNKFFHTFISCHGLVYILLVIVAHL